MDRLITRLSGRDRRDIKREQIGVTLDTSGEGRYGYWFGVHLGDSVMDGTVLPERKFSDEWDGAWRAATQHRTVGQLSSIFRGERSPCQLFGKRVGIYMSRL